MPCVCGQPIEDGRGGRLGICYGCHLDTWLPPWFEEREDYERVLVGVHTAMERARRLPRAGVPFLDAGSSMPTEAAFRSVLTPEQVEAMVERENSVGLDVDELEMLAHSPLVGEKKLSGRAFRMGD